MLIYKYITSVNKWLHVNGFTELLSPDPVAFVEQTAIAPLQRSYIRTMVHRCDDTTLQQFGGFPHIDRWV